MALRNPNDEQLPFDINPSEAGLLNAAYAGNQPYPGYIVYDPYRLSSLVVKRGVPLPEWDQPGSTAKEDDRVRSGTLLQFPAPTAPVNGEVMQDAEEEAEPYVGILRTDDEANEARRLVARVYSDPRNGYITEVTEDGYMTEADDPWVKQSTYFGYRSGGKIHAACRSIKLPDVSQYPAVSKFDNVDINVLAENITHAEDVDNPELFEEISALACERGDNVDKQSVVKLYAAMMQDTIKHGGRYWLMSADIRVAKMLKILFGTENFTPLRSEPQDYMGSPTLPMVVDTYKIVKSVARHDSPFRASVREVALSQWDPEVLEIVNDEEESGAELPIEEQDTQIIEFSGPSTDTAKDGPRHNLITGKRLALAGVIGYTLLRAGVIPLTSLDQQGVNTGVFLGIDVLTAYPYVDGLDRLTNRNNSFVHRAIGLGEAAVSFALPYAYVGLEAHQSPQIPEAGALFGAALIGAIAIKKVYGAVQRFLSANHSALPSEG